MEKDSNLFANIEERKEPLLVPPLNLDDLNDDEPLRGDGEAVTFRGDSVHAVERVPAIDQALEEIPTEVKIFDQNEKDAINGLRAYHFTPDSKKWQHKIFMRKHLNTLAKASDLSKDLEIENSDIQDIAFGDAQLALDILQRKAQLQDMRSKSEAEIKDAMDKYFSKKKIQLKEEVKPEKSESEYSRSQIGMDKMWDKAIEVDRDQRNLIKEKSIIPQQDSTLEKFGALAKQERMMTIPQANEWILKNQGKATEILEKKFTEKMDTYDKFKRDFGCRHQDINMLSVQGQVQYLAKVNNGKLQLEHYRFNQLVKVITLNDDLSQGHSSLVSYQQCGSFIYFFKVKTIEDDQIQETLPTDITANPALNRGISTMSLQKNIKKYILELCQYDMSLDSLDNEPIIVQQYEVPMKFDTQSGIQMPPIAVIFVNQQTSQFSKTKQNWPKGIPGNDCQKFLESMVMAIVYQNPDNQSYKLSFRSINLVKFSESELFYTQKSFPPNKCLQILVAKKNLNKDLPSASVLMVFCAGKGYYAFSTETMLCMSTGGGIGTYISKIIDLEAFKPQNKALQALLNKVTTNMVNFYDSSFQIIDEKQDYWQIKNRDVFYKIWRLVEKLLASKSKNYQMPQIQAFYDVSQDVMTINIGRQNMPAQEVIFVNRKNGRELIAESLRDQSNSYGFVPPHLRVMQLKHQSSQQTLTNFIEDRDCFIQASYQYTNLIRDNQVVYLQYKVEGDPIVKELQDSDFAVNFLNSDIIHQDKYHKKGSLFMSNGHSSSFGPYQIAWMGDMFKVQRDCEKPNRVIMEKIIFQEDDRQERPIIVVKESQFGKIESLWIMTYNFLNHQVNNQQEITIEKEDLDNIQEVFFSASSDIIDEISPKVVGTCSQKFQVCLQMITNQIKIIEFQVNWIPNKQKDAYTTSCWLKGQKLISLQNQNLGEILFFGPLFKQNYEIFGSQIVQRDDFKLSFLNMENTKAHEFQFQNEFADIAYTQVSQVLIVEVVLSQKLIQEKNLSTKEKLEVSEQMIQAALIVMPFKVHEYLLTDDWSSQFFTNQELLNGYSIADFSLSDPALLKQQISLRMTEKRDNLLSVEMQEFDPIFEKTIHLTSLLEKCRQYFQASKMALIEPMLLEVDNLNLNSTKYLILLENLDIIILSNCQKFQQKLLSSECVIDLSPLQLKRKLNSLSYSSKIQNFTSYDLALNLSEQRLNINDVVKLALIDQQWKISKFYYGVVAVIYVAGHFCPYYFTLYNEGNFGKISGLIALFTSWLFIGLSITALKQGVNKLGKTLDIIFFAAYTLYYFLHGQKSSLETLLESADEVGEEVLSNEFLQILTVLLIFHSIFKLAELMQSIELFRKTSMIIKCCFVDVVKLIGVLFVIIGAFSAVNQVLSKEPIGFGESMTQIYESSFSFDLIEQQDSSQIQYFSVLVKLLQQFIVPVILINLVITTLIQSYDQALGHDAEHYHCFKAQWNLELFSLMKSFMRELPALARLEFQVSQELEKSLEETKTKWNGFVKTIQNFIHEERLTSETNMQIMASKVESIEQTLNQALGNKLPQIEKDAAFKANSVASDVSKVKTMVQSLLDKQAKQEDEKQLKVTQQTSGGWLGAFGGPRSSIISTKGPIIEEEKKQSTPTKSERMDSAQSPRRKTPTKQIDTQQSARREQITSRYKERSAYASPIRSVRK